MKLPIIQSLWIGDDLTNYEKLCIQSFLDHGHEFHLYTYTNIGGIPASTNIKDGNEILAESEIFTTKRGGLAPFSDWFRYALLAKHGNFWVDMDMFCVKPFDFTEEIVFSHATLVFPLGNGVSLGNSPLKMPKEHEMMVQLAEACRVHSKVQPWDNSETIKSKRNGRLSKGKKDINDEDFGSPTFYRVAKYFNLLQWSKPYMVFEPIPQTINMFDDSFKSGIDFYEQTKSIDVHNSVLRTLGLNKNANYDSFSLYEQLKKKHNILPVAGAEKITSKQIQNKFLNIDDKQKIDLRKRRIKQRILIAFIITLLFSICLIN